MLNNVSVTIRRRRYAGRGRQQLTQVGHIGVRVNLDIGPRQTAAVDQAGVVLGVAEDDIAAVRQTGQRADVRGKSGREDQRGLGLFKRGQLALPAPPDSPFAP